MNCPHLDFFKALQEGVRQAAQENSVIGGTEQFRNPNEYKLTHKNGFMRQVDISLEEFFRRLP